MAVPTTGLIAEFLMENVTGEPGSQVMADTAPESTRSASLEGSVPPTVVTGTLGNALRFANTNSGGTPESYCALSESIDVDGPWALPFWIKLPTWEDQAVIMSMTGEGGEWFNGISVNRGYSVIVRKGSYTYKSTDYFPDDTDWNFVVIQESGVSPNQVIQVYVNGVKLGDDIPASHVSGIELTHIGCQGTVAELSAHLVGDLDGLRFYSRALTPEEIFELFLEGEVTAGEVNASFFLNPMTLDGSGNFNASCNIQPMLLEGSGFCEPTGIGDLVAQAATIIAGGAGNALVDLEAPVLSATGISTVTGEFNATLGGMQLNGSGFCEVTGSADINMPGISLVGSGWPENQGDFDASLQGMQIIASGIPGVAGSADMSVIPLSMQASGYMEIIGIAELFMDEIEMAAVGTAPERFKDLILQYSRD